MISTLLIAALLGAGPVVVIGPTSPQAPQWRAVRWLDGAVQRDAWVDATSVAELNPSDQGASQVKATFVGALVSSSTPSLRIWSVPDAAVLIRADPSRFVEVLRDEATPSSRLRVAGGGVLVSLSPSVNVERFLASTGASLISQKGSLLVLWAPPGRESVTLANRLASLQGVTFAQPNWRFSPTRK